MLEPTRDAAMQNPEPSPETVTTRVNVAFPFSQIKIQEPSADLAALAALVRDLTELVAEITPGPAAEELVERARAVTSRLGT